MFFLIFVLFASFFVFFLLCSPFLTIIKLLQLCIKLKVLNSCKANFNFLTQISIYKMDIFITLIAVLLFHTLENFVIIVVYVKVSNSFLTKFLQSHIQHNQKFRHSRSIKCVSFYLLKSIKTLLFWWYFPTNYLQE